MTILRPKESANLTPFLSVVFWGNSAAMNAYPGTKRTAIAPIMGRATVALNTGTLATTSAASARPNTRIRSSKLLMGCIAFSCIGV